MLGTLSGIALDRPGRGTYSVNANCTGTFSILLPDPIPPIVTRFVIVDGGKELRIVVVSPQGVRFTDPAIKPPLPSVASNLFGLPLRLPIREDRAAGVLRRDLGDAVGRVIRI